MGGGSAVPRLEGEGEGWGEGHKLFRADVHDRAV